MHHPTYKIGATHGNTFQWNFGGLHTVRKDIAEINQLLAVLCFVLPAPPPQGSCNFLGQSVGVKESFPVRLVVFVRWWMNHVPKALYTFLGISEFCKRVSANSVPRGGGAGRTKHRTARSLLISAISFLTVCRPPKFQ